MNYNLITENITLNYGANLLRTRGIDNVERFLEPTSNCLQYWGELENINDGIQMIANTIYSEKPYALIVDCDVDGFTSSAILYQYLKKLNPQKKIEYFVHSGKQHGLEDMWEKLLDEDYAAILIPDAGRFTA